MRVDTGTEKVAGLATSAMMEEAASVDWLLAALGVLDAPLLCYEVLKLKEIIGDLYNFNM